MATAYRSRDFSIMKIFTQYVFAVLSALLIYAACPEKAWGQQYEKQLQTQRAQAAKTRPVQNDVEIDPIAAEEIPMCELVVSADNRQMKLLSPQKIVLRNFANTNNDPGLSQQVDQWSYYQDGVEVYREMDTTGNGKQDQFRWLNSAGTRWGVDTTGDGNIDFWKEISAEEVSREIILALAHKDAQRFLNVTLKEDELKSLALGDALNSVVAKKVAALKTVASNAGFAQAAAAVALTDKAEWHQLSAALPGVVPKGEQGNQKDLRVFENAAATISDGGNIRQIVIGTLVQIGDNNWRVLDLPHNYDYEHVSFTFIQPVHAQGSTGPADSDIVAMMNQVEALQAQIPTMPAAQRPKKHEEVIELLFEIIKKSSTLEERENWTQIMADTIMIAVERGEFPEGKERIDVVFKAANRPDMQELAAHVRSRQIMVNYYVALSAEGSDKMRAYSQWLADLEEMVSTFPKTKAGLEGMLQLASCKEMADSSNEEAIKWYNKVIELVPTLPVAAKAKGAILRLSAEGKEIPFRGTDTTGKAFDIAEYKGKYVLLCFWESASAAQLPLIKVVTDKFESSGLITVGINLDSDAATLQKSLQGLPVTWRQLYAPDGLEGALAMYWGIMTPPCMILYNKEGKVIRSTISTVEELQQVLAESVK